MRHFRISLIAVAVGAAFALPAAAQEWAGSGSTSTDTRVTDTTVSVSDTAYTDRMSINTIDRSTTQVRSLTATQLTGLTSTDVAELTTDHGARQKAALQRQSALGAAQERGGPGAAGRNPGGRERLRHGGQTGGGVQNLRERPGPARVGWASA